MRHRLAIINCGGMEGTHAGGLDLLADRLEVVATVDPVIERAEAAAALVVTPHHTHFEIGTDLLATKLGYSIHVHGTEGMLEADLRAGKLRLHTRAGAKTLTRTDPQAKYVDRELGQFLDCIERQTPVPTDGPTSLQGLRVIWRLYQAEREHVVADLTGLGFDDRWDVPGLDRLPTETGR